MPRPPKRLRTSDHSMAVGISTDPQMSMETDIKLFTHLVGCGLSVEQLSDIPSAQLTNESLATILNIIHDAQRFTKPRTMDGEFKNIDSCQIAISTVSGLADALRDAHDKKSYYSICSMGKCSPISQSTLLTSYTRGTPSAPAQDANGFARNETASASPIP